MELFRMHFHKLTEAAIAPQDCFVCQLALQWKERNLPYVVIFIMFLVYTEKNIF